MSDCHLQRGAGGRFRFARVGLAAALVAFFLPACGDSLVGGGGETGTAPGLRAVSLEIIEPAKLTAGHEALVRTRVEAEADFREVILGYYMVPQSAAGTPAMTASTKMLASRNVNVPAGAMDVDAWVLIPDDITQVESHFLIVQIDPIRAQITEEVDNVIAMRVQVEVADRTRPDIYVESVVCDRETVDLRFDGLGLPQPQFPSLVVDAVVGVSGSATVSNCPIAVIMDIPDRGQAAAAAGPVRLEIWNDAANAFGTTFPIPTLAPGDPTAAHLMTRVPIATQVALNAAGVNLWEVVINVVADPDDAIVEFEDGTLRLPEDDNVAWKPMHLMIFRERVNTADSTNSISFDVRYRGDSHTVPWPTSAFDLLRSLSQTFLLKVSPDVRVRGHAGKFTGAFLAASGHIDYHAWPKLLPKPEDPAVEFDFVFIANENDIRDSAYSLEVSIEGDPVDIGSQFEDIVDLANCTPKVVPLVMTEIVPVDATIPAPGAPMIGPALPGTYFTGGLRAALDIEASVCGMVAADEATIDANLTLRGQASVFGSMGIEFDLGDIGDLPWFIAILLPTLRVGAEAEVTLIDHLETVKGQVKAGLSGSASFPNGGVEIWFERHTEARYLSQELSIALGVVGSEGPCVRVGHSLWPEIGSTNIGGVTIGTNGIKYGSDADCVEKIKWTRFPIMGLPPLLIDHDSTPRQTYRFEFR